jgi:hypothetical protein
MRPGAPLFVAIFLVTATSAMALDYRPTILPAADIVAVVEEEGAVIVVDGESRRHRVVLSHGTLRIEPTPPARKPLRRTNMLDDGDVSVGTRNIHAAWLTQRTRRYGHAVLGDAIEAGGLSVELADGKTLSLTLPDDSVFEDRLARVADIDGDGDDEVLVVRSYLDRGATLAIVEAAGGELRVAAEAPPIGLPHRWLNFVGVADFDDDGRVEAALVENPHIGGILKLYEMRGERLALDLRRDGFSNHFIGSPVLAMSAVFDADDDGVPDIALPGVARQTLRVVTFANGTFAELARVDHQHRIVTAIVATDLDDDGTTEIVYALHDGALVVLGISP